MPPSCRPRHQRCFVDCQYCIQKPKAQSTVKLTREHLQNLIDIVPQKQNHLNLTGGEILGNKTSTLNKLFDYGHKSFSKTIIETQANLLTKSNLKNIITDNLHISVNFQDMDILKTNFSSRRDKNERFDSQFLLHLDQKSDLSAQIILQPEVMSEKHYTSNMKKFIEWLGNHEIKSGRINLIEKNNTPCAPDDSSRDRLTTILIELARFLEGRPELKWDPFHKIEKNLLGKFPGARGFLGPCSPINHPRIPRADASENESNPGRKSIFNFTSPSRSGLNYPRLSLLLQKSQAEGGCSDCRFFIICLGHCPAEGSSANPLHRSKYCKQLQDLFAFYEQKICSRGSQPVTRHPRTAELKKLLSRQFKKPGRAPTYRLLRKKLGPDEKSSRNSHNSTSQKSRRENGGSQKTAPTEGQREKDDKNEVSQRSLASNHADGVQHLDQKQIHIDTGNVGPDSEQKKEIEKRSSEDHSDGIRHLDENNLHIDGIKSASREDWDYDPDENHNDGHRHLDAQHFHVDGNAG